MTVLAWITTVAILAAYFTASRRPSRLRLYHAANVVGAIVLDFYNASLGAWPTVALNGAYGLIAAWALLK